MQVLQLDTAYLRKRLKWANLADEAGDQNNNLYHFWVNNVYVTYIHCIVVTQPSIIFQRNVLLLPLFIHFVLTASFQQPTLLDGNIPTES